MLRAGALAMDCAAHRVEKDGIPVELTAKEYAILELLLRNPRRVYTKAQLYAAVWGEAYLGDENAVNVHISRLRSKVEDDPQKAPLHLHGLGHWLQAGGWRWAVTVCCCFWLPYWALRRSILLCGSGGCGGSFRRRHSNLAGYFRRRERRSVARAAVRRRFDARCWGRIDRLLLEKKKLCVQQRRARLAQRRMLANMAHDLRTPLTVLLGQLEIARLRGEESERCAGCRPKPKKCWL